ncbi:hypothetical protein A3H53_02040 [Candidatus Nomurabacteria bacterium RIFCSPLOWO2_02_FULL_40_10]|uniref:Pyrophosphatase PpaX n=2 Tax=Candidatus Nomuraibacteriota TaxID=1752729 RepID=A0A1F6XW91_9BACT|nr:MAG: hypothetical protein A2642_00425 [Candidatus Nomurabacteria bacterium RIFCSPHIGHO2_01_FULL_39_10]OGI98374.1 MAG: hypothetical protein A3H53_02040 [Candidatus Nomurabacteria bacterium RIFCSPLOWO2_02_FULL_40_10]
MKGITTLLFDIDGTILDTREFILQATEHALTTLNYPVPKRSVISKLVGIPFLKYYFKLSGSEKDAEKLMNTHREFQRFNFHLAKLFPNTCKTLHKLKKKGYRLGAITSRSKITSKQTLKDAGVFDLFDIILSAEDTKDLKPHPEPLLKALRYMKEAPERAVMIGDSHLDIETGKNAGTKTIRATYGFHKDNLHNPEPDFFIDDISDLLKLLQN